MEELKEAIKTLNNNKAPDIFGLTAEHLKNGEEHVFSALLDIINTIIMDKNIPSDLKIGILTPVYKKGKPDNPSNYRGISVTLVILKLLEQIISSRHDLLLIETQSDLQYGFTRRKSSLISAFLLSECQLETKSNKQQMYLTTLDTQKAFDVVSHEILLHKLYFDGIQDQDWLLIKDLYTDMTSKVKWNGEYSRSFPILQGVRQGGILSTGHYKRYNNPLLLQLEQNFDGVSIGTERIQHITCADDLALLSTTPNEMCKMVTHVEDYSNDSRYKINPSKSNILQCHTKIEFDKPILQGKVIEKASTTTHLGILRQEDGKLDVQERVNTGRRTLYSLMGAGCHGKTGVSQIVKAHLWTVYVVPRFIYGLETLPVAKSDEKSLETFQNKALKQIQHLPDRTSNTATLALLGVLPLTSVIHKNLLNLFYTMISTPNTKEYNIVFRQLAVKRLSDKSMISLCRRLLLKYKLPTAYDLMNKTPSRESWKQSLKEAIHTEVIKEWQKDIMEKPSLKYLNHSALKIGKPHPLYTTVRSNSHDIQRAEIKAKLLTGTYTLQANRSRFNQYTVNPTCGLCLMQPETREHFISQCTSLSDIRQSFITKVANVLQVNSELLFSLEPAQFTQLCLDCTHPNLQKDIEIRQEYIHNLEFHTREYILKIHFRRSKILSSNQN